MIGIKPEIVLQILAAEDIGRSGILAGGAYQK
jgi:hypothetical protein